MSFNTTTQRGAPVYSGAGKFGAGSLSGGVLVATAGVIPTGVMTDKTFEAWIKVGTVSSVKVAFGCYNYFWVGVAADHTLRCAYGNTDNKSIATNVVMTMVSGIMSPSA